MAVKASPLESKAKELIVYRCPISFSQSLFKPFPRGSIFTAYTVYIYEHQISLVFVLTQFVNFEWTSHAKLNRLIHFNRGVSVIYQFADVYHGLSPTKGLSQNTLRPVWVMSLSVLNLLLNKSLKRSWEGHHVSSLWTTAGLRLKLPLSNKQRPTQSRNLTVKIRCRASVAQFCGTYLIKQSSRVNCGLV